MNVGGIPPGILPILNENQPNVGPGTVMFQDGSGAPIGSVVSGITSEMMNN